MVVALLPCALPSAAHAQIIVQIGNDNGFGGLTSTNPGAPPGTPINQNTMTSSSALFTTPVALNETDRRSANGLLTLNYDFALNTTSLLSIQSAQVLIRMASVGLGTDNGFGNAQVSFAGSALGRLRPGGLNGNSPEVIQEFAFDVTNLVAPGTNTVMRFSLNGTGLTGNDAQDVFTVDLARLTVSGAASAPEPGSLVLLGFVILPLIAYGVVRQRAKHGT